LIFCALYFITFVVNIAVKWDVALICLLLEFELALLYFDGALKLEEFALF